MTTEGRLFSENVLFPADVAACNFQVMGDLLNSLEELKNSVRSSQQAMLVLSEGSNLGRGCSLEVEGFSRSARSSPCHTIH